MILLLEFIMCSFLNFLAKIVIAMVKVVSGVATVKVFEVGLFAEPASSCLSRAGVLMPP